jgi:hypothetical protein
MNYEKGVDASGRKEKVSQYAPTKKKKSQKLLLLIYFIFGYMLKVIMNGYRERVCISSLTNMVLMLMATGIFLIQNVTSNIIKLLQTLFCFKIKAS